MTLTLTDIAVQTVSNVISNLPWFILIIWGVRVISKEIGKGVKQIPEWIETYHIKQMERIKIGEALGRMGR